MLKVDENVVKALKAKYPKGTRVILVVMDDVQAPPVGTEGTVEDVDDIGSLCVRWDNGSSLHVIYGVDKVDIVQKKCPKCGRYYSGHSALSRIDNLTEICPRCGTTEALDSIFMDDEQKGKIFKELDEFEKKD